MELPDSARFPMGYYDALLLPARQSSGYNIIVTRSRQFRYFGKDKQEISSRPAVGLGPASSLHPRACSYKLRRSCLDMTTPELLLHAHVVIFSPVD
jgi:hypothetical protein